MKREEIRGGTDYGVDPYDMPWVDNIKPRLLLDWLEKK